ncbi:MAG: cytochrome P450 [Pseudomonadota bacterium]
MTNEADPAASTPAAEGGKTHSGDRIEQAAKVPFEPVRPDALDSVNLLSSEVQNCPYPAYSLLREQAPVWKDPVTGFFVVSRFEDVKTILMDPKLFVNSMRGGQNTGSQLDRERADRMQKLYETKGWVPAPTLAGRDDPDHREMRGMLRDAFRPKVIKEMDPFVRDTAYRLIDDFIDEGSCDWVHQFAVPFPLIIIGHQMGVPEADIWRIKAWTDAWIQRLGLMQSEEEERWSVEMEIEAQHYFQPIFERLREEPDDSLLSHMVNEVIPEWGRPLNDNELHAEMMADTFVGGSETTTNAIAYGLKLLVENPEIWSQLRDDPDRHMRTFCEEVLRLEGPVQGLFRMTSEDVELHGVQIPKGSMINVRYAAANRDEREFECPEQLKLDRERTGRHLAFGSGVHHCLGAPLARRELFWAFRALVDRVDQIEFQEGMNDFQQAPSFSLRALSELHIRFDAKALEDRVDPSQLDVESNVPQGQMM